MSDKRPLSKHEMMRLIEDVEMGRRDESDLAEHGIRLGEWTDVSKADLIKQAANRDRSIDQQVVIELYQSEVSYDDRAEIEDALVEALEEADAHAEASSTDWENLSELVDLIVEEARRVVREWIDADDDRFDPFGELATAERTRRRVRDRFGCGPGHEVPAARARGRHHALAYVTQAWDEVDETLPKVSAEGLRTLHLVRADQIEIRPPEWLLRGILERDTFALVFGDPGCGKSFLAIDWAARVATGTPWRGEAVQGGPVVYVAGEGQRGFGRRIRAWELHHGVSLAEKPLYLSPAVAMPDPGDLAALTNAIDTGVATVGQPALIVLDTLARNFGGGDENSTQDMTRFVAACDAIRNRYGSTVLVVHHTGHAEKTRARGAMALKAALDAEYRLEQTGNNEALLTATKMKDAEEPAPLALSLVTVDLPGVVDDYGNQANSAAVEVIDANTAEIEAKARAVTTTKRGRWQQVGLEIAQRLIAKADHGRAGVRDWHEQCDAARDGDLDAVRIVDGERIQAPDCPASDPVSNPIQPL